MAAVTDQDGGCPVSGKVAATDGGGGGQCPVAEWASCESATAASNSSVLVQLVAAGAGADPGPLAVAVDPSPWIHGPCVGGANSGTSLKRKLVFIF